jgi:hypothetical protein
LNLKPFSSDVGVGSGRVVIVTHRRRGSTTDGRDVLHLL